MKFLYSFKKTTFYPLEGFQVEVRTHHSLLFGLVKWTTSKIHPNNLSA